MPTPPLPVADLVAWCALIGALFAGLRWLYRQARAAGRTLDQLSAMLKRELNPNSGSSMKDDVAAIVQALHSTNVRIDTLDGRQANTEDILHNLAEANHLIWPAIQAVAEATPPHHDERHENGIQGS